jgi:hypothetical protein
MPTRHPRKKKAVALHLIPTLTAPPLEYTAIKDPKLIPFDPNRWEDDNRCTTIGKDGKRCGQVKQAGMTKCEWCIHMSAGIAKPDYVKKAYARYEVLPEERNKVLGVLAEAASEADPTQEIALMMLGLQETLKADEVDAEKVFDKAERIAGLEIKHRKTKIAEAKTVTHDQFRAMVARMLDAVQKGIYEACGYGPPGDRVLDRVRAEIQKAIKGTSGFGVTGE